MFSPVKNVVLVICFSIWFYLTDIQVKICSIAFSSIYSCIEYSWYSCSTELPNGEVIFTPFASTCRKGFTSFAQFWVNVLFVPIFVDCYYDWLLPNSFWLQVILFPINIWTLEIVEGYFITWFYGRNVAWFYTDNLAFFHGNISLHHGKLWLLLGFFSSLFYPLLRAQVYRFFA
eukprot:TRINITY_DN13268_c0_g1_i1.p1 TRINITY_DN13268_c0_g1~~TRINITY_DN13268_c0_g1_i1.p1  ORF type:complete len:174 (-),score=26.21 TRINITY_DN13268_c0_g1_i1:132-653(-)